MRFPEQPPLASSTFIFLFIFRLFFFSFPLNTAFGWSNQMVSDGLRLYFFFFQSALFIYGVFAAYSNKARFCRRVELCTIACVVCLAARQTQWAGRHKSKLLPHIFLFVFYCCGIWAFGVDFFFFLLLFSIRRVIRDLQSCSITQHALRNSPSARTLLRCLLQSPSSWSPVIIQQFKNFFSSFLKNKTKQNKVSLPRD